MNLDKMCCTLRKWPTLYFSVTVVQVIVHQVFNTVLKEISCVGRDMSSPFPCGDLNKLTLTV